MVRQAHHERNQLATVRPEPVEGLNQHFPHCHSAISGFTLIELIVVIVILAVITVGFTSMYTQSIEQYLDANRRNELSASARTALERISREVRDALPNSVRVDGSGQCVEFRAVVSGELYLDLPLGTPQSSFSAAAFTPPAGSWSVAVMPLQVSEVYDPSAGDNKAVVGIASVSAPSANVVQVNLVSANRFLRPSQAQRFFVTGAPVSFCVTSGELRRYGGYGVSASQPIPGAGLSGGELLCGNLLTSSNAFSYTAGTLERNALLHMDFTLGISGEQISHEHEALIRNVP